MLLGAVPNRADEAQSEADGRRAESKGEGEGGHMPTRLIRDGINSSGRVNALSPLAELFYRRLLLVVDDYGRTFASAPKLRGDCWPTTGERIAEAEVTSWLSECIDAQLVTVYIVKGVNYLQINDFGQKVRAKRSKFPGPDETENESAKQMLSKCSADAKQMLSKCSADAGHLLTLDERRETRDERRETRDDARASEPTPIDPFYKRGPSEDWQKREKIARELFAYLDSAHVVLDPDGTNRVQDVNGNSAAGTRLLDLFKVSVNPEIEAGAIKRKHKAIIEHWTQHGGGKTLFYWILDGDYMRDPPKPKAPKPERDVLERVRAGR